MLDVELNIETLPHPGLQPMSFVNEVALGNATKPETIRLKQAEGSLKLWKDCSKHVLRGWVFIVSYRVDGQDPVIMYNISEPELLREFDGIIEGWRANNHLIRWHTFNGLHFDYRVLRLRAVKYGLGALLEEMTCPKWGDELHFDWMLKLGADARGEKNMGLDDFAKFFELNGDNPIGGKDILDQHLAGDKDKIMRHAKSRITYLRDIRQLHHDALNPPVEDVPF